jgi:membrane protease YdiL (CAAX protease family)
VTSSPQRLRSTWLRLPAFFIVQLAAVVGTQIAMRELSRISPVSARDATALAAALLLSAALTGVYVLLVRCLEQRAASELAPWPGLTLLPAGAVGGLAVFCITYGLLWWLGDAQWQGPGGPAGLLPALSMAILAGVGEELMFRGGVFRILEGSLGTAAALILSAAVFGGMHAANHGATLVSTGAIALEAGVLLGAAYAATRSLWLPIGLHLGWNFTEGGLFGASVSGGHTHPGLVQMPLAGPDWATGGVFGPEASLVAVGVCLLAASMLIVLAIRRGQWIAMPFSLARSP